MKWELIALVMIIAIISLTERSSMWSSLTSLTESNLAIVCYIAELSPRNLIREKKLNRDKAIKMPTSGLQPRVAIHVPLLTIGRQIEAAGRMSTLNRVFL